MSGSAKMAFNVAGTVTLTSPNFGSRLNWICPERRKGRLLNCNRPFQFACYRNICRFPGVGRWPLATPMALGLIAYFDTDDPTFAFVVLRLRGFTLIRFGRLGPLIISSLLYISTLLIPSSSGWKREGRQANPVPILAYLPTGVN